MNRREFLRKSALGLATTSLAPWQAMAGPFDPEDFENLIPRDKRLRPEWIASLFARGKRTTYTGEDLNKIGMPIGGICAGQVYLGGDGSLWHWDLFNQSIRTGSEHYANPLTPKSPVDQGFALLVRAKDRSEIRPLDKNGWKDVRFTGEYPVGFVSYRDPETPVSVSLESFSPFIPLNVEDSSWPATVMRFTVKNAGKEEAHIELAGWLENAVCLYSGTMREGQRHNRIVRKEGLLMLDCSAGPLPPSNEKNDRPDIVFADFEGKTYDPWVAEGEAFGKGPVAMKEIPHYQGDVGGLGLRAVNSHASAPGDDVGSKDAPTGTLTSPSFVIERDFITFLVGGGSHKGKTCVNLIVNEEVVLSATGKSDNRMGPNVWDVRPWKDKSARIQVVDQETEGWGNIGVDHIVFTDVPRAVSAPMEKEADFGTMGLALLGNEKEDRAIASLPDQRVPAGLFSQDAGPYESPGPVSKKFNEQLVGSLSRDFRLSPGESKTVTFLFTWHFPNLKLDEKNGLIGRHYAERFDSALHVAEKMSANFDRLRKDTLLWHDTWYDSTLPYWFLDRTFLNASTLATSTCHRFSNGRFYGWEGVGSCAGTCGHVWQYAQSVARLFPELERSTREKVDFGLAQQPDGAIHFRGEFNNIAAVDGQAGTILRALREHQMSTDDSWLKRNWPKIKLALEWLIGKDENDDGIIEGKQHNTLDADWYGPVAWLSGEYLASLAAGELMAKHAGDEDFEMRCRAILDRGRDIFVRELFNGEYFINKPDPKHPEAINSGTGCHIDQVLGESWAFQVGLGRILPEAQTLSALRSLWRYNFTPDVGPWREANAPGRWYAMPGEAGLVMCTFPDGSWDYDKAKGKGAAWAAGYFNECMNGFEYQAAGHMIWEGMVREGLAVTRAVHDRYHPSRRNPWNEVECGDHYARSMASHGVFLAACGYEHSGPEHRLGFAPRLTPEKFRCAFTACSGWGTFRQEVSEGKQYEEIELQYGHLVLEQLTFLLSSEVKAPSLEVYVNGRALPAKIVKDGEKVLIHLQEPIDLGVGDTLSVVMG